MKNVKKLILILVLSFIVNTVIANDVKKELDKSLLVTISNEETLKIEDWMINSNIWYSEIKEDILQIEDWMINEFYWNVEYYNIEDEELKIENWMINSEIFN